jgi:glucose-1-phosphate cytidylyltransferase
MKVVILAGGLPSKLIEEDEKIPKPMAEIGGRPILWHIMKQYAYYGYNDFIICGGYRVDFIKEYFMNFYIYQSDITVDLSSNDVVIHRKKTEDWNVTVVDTGRDASIPQRLCAIRELVNGEEFIVAYGDCVSDIDVRKMIDFHQKGGQTLTLAVARPNGRNELMPIRHGEFTKEISRPDDAWVNACNMVCTEAVYRYINSGMKTEGQMFASVLKPGIAVPYIHDGFWVPMETVRDKSYLQFLWEIGKAPWKVWDD